MVYLQRTAEHAQEEEEGERQKRRMGRGKFAKRRLSTHKRNTRENGRRGWDVRYLQRNAERAQEDDEGEREKRRMERDVFAKDG